MLVLSQTTTRSAKASAPSGNCTTWSI
jgi:hypothetical protein